MKRDFTCQKGRKVTIKEKSKTQFVDMDKITYIQCEGHLTILHTISTKSFTASKLLKTYEEELSEFGFVRANRSTIINMLHVKQYTGGCKRVLKLVKNIEICISRRKVFLFRQN